LEKLRSVRMLCVYGREEETSGCRDAPEGLMKKDARNGGHHFDRDTDALVAHVLSLLAK
jgi:type IV secretory pathway VirJ component